jgi:hypothetical protein
MILPEHFPIGSHVSVVSSHPRHAKTIGVVTRHTTKFVTFSPLDFPQVRIRIFPQSLMLMPPPAAAPPKPCNNRTTQRCVALSATEDEHSRTQGRKECDNDTLTNSRKQQTSMSETDTSVSPEHFAILAPSCTTVFVMTTTSQRR